MKNIFIWLVIIILLPLISFYTVMEGYSFFKPIEVFHQIVGRIIPLFFPIIVIILFLTNFTQEQKNNFITYTRPRIPLNIYILSKGLMNAFLTGAIIFLTIFLSFVFSVYIEPHYLKFIDFSYEGNTYSVTFYQFLPYGDFTYGIAYSLWVSINAILYSTISFLLLLLLRRSFVALSAPFLFYHIFNFVAGVFGVAKFSPVSTIFPFNIQLQPLWTVLVPFTFLLIISLFLYSKVIRNKEEWMI